MEKEMRFMKEVLEGILGKCGALDRENKEIKIEFQEYEHTYKRLLVNRGLNLPCDFVSFFTPVFARRVLKHLQRCF